MTFAVWTRRWTAEKTCVFGRYLEIELEPTSGILANRTVHNSMAAGCPGFISPDRCLHFSSLLALLGGVLSDETKIFSIFMREVAPRIGTAQLDLSPLN